MSNKRALVAIGGIALSAAGIWATKNSWSIPAMPHMPMWGWGVAVVVLAAVIYAVKRKRNHHGSQPSPTPTPTPKTPWIYMDDTGDRYRGDGNGPQDVVCALALSEIYGEPLLLGATYYLNSRGTDPRLMKDICKAVRKGHLQVAQGAPRYGMRQGSSQLSREIVEHALQHDKLIIAVGGPVTDIALAIKQKPEIAKRLRLSVLAGWNWDQDPESAAYVNKHVRGINRIDHDEWKIVMKKVFADRSFGNSAKERGDNFAAHYFGFNSALRKHVMNNHWTGINRMLNGGQIGVATALRIADLLAIFMAFEGKNKGLDGNHIYPILKTALNKLRKNNGK